MKISTNYIGHKEKGDFERGTGAGKEYLNTCELRHRDAQFQRKGLPWLHLAGSAAFFSMQCSRHRTVVMKYGVPKKVR